MDMVDYKNKILDTLDNALNDLSEVIKEEK